MPHRRSVRKGSFGGRIDQLVEHFPEGAPRPRGKAPTEAGPTKPDDRHINDRLFEGAWRTAGETSRLAGAKQP